MATAAHGFRRRVKDRQAKVRPEISFFLESFDEDEDGNEVVVRRDDFVAKMPTEEQMLLIFAMGGREDATIGDEIASILDVLKSSLGPEQYRVLYRRLKDPDDLDVTIESIEEIFEWLVEQWQDFPTQPSAGSSGSQASSGGRSTGRAPGKGSTLSSSASDAS